MNADHIDMIKHYCDSSEEILIMVGINSAGFNLRIGTRVLRINIKESITSAMDVRQTLVEKAKQ